MQTVPQYEVVDATTDHVVPLAFHLRQSDINEIWAASALLPVQGILESIKGSTVARTWLINGLPVAMGGIKPWPSAEQGLIWFLATNEILRHKFKFIIESRREFIEKRSNFSMVHNWVDDRDKQAIRWLRWLGFHMEEPRPHGVFGKPFRYFWKEV